jgi:hypothetical protein
LFAAPTKSFAASKHFDCVARINAKVLIISPCSYGNSTGAKEAARIGKSLKAFPFMVEVIKATFSLPSFDANFDIENGKNSNPELDKSLLYQS